MNRREFHIGPGAASLLLIMVVLCMGVLGALTLVSARNDARLSDRTLMVAEISAQLNARSEQTLAELDAILKEASAAENEEAYFAAIEALLPENMEFYGNSTISWQESSEEGRKLDCEVTLTPFGEFPRYTWQTHMMWTDMSEMDFGTEYGFFVP